MTATKVISDINFYDIGKKFGCEFPGKHYFQSPASHLLLLEDREESFPGPRRAEVSVAQPIVNNIVLVRRSSANPLLGPVSYSAALMWHSKGITETIEAMFYALNSEDTQKLRYKVHDNPNVKPEIKTLDTVSQDYVVKAWPQLVADALAIVNDPGTVLTESPKHKAYFEVSYPW